MLLFGPFWSTVESEWQQTNTYILSQTALTFCPMLVKVLMYRCTYLSNLSWNSWSTFKNTVLCTESDRFPWCYAYLFMPFLLISTYGLSEKLPTSCTMSPRHLVSFSVQLFTCYWASLDWNLAESQLATLQTMRMHTNWCVTSWNNIAFFESVVIHTSSIPLWRILVHVGCHSGPMTACHLGASTGSINSTTPFPLAIATQKEIFSGHCTIFKPAPHTLNFLWPLQHKKKLFTTDTSKNSN